LHYTSIIDFYTAKEDKMGIKRFIMNSLMKIGKWKLESAEKRGEPYNIFNMRKDLMGYNALLGMMQPARKDITLDDESLGGFPTIHAQAPQKAKRTILFLHGGGYNLAMKHMGNIYRYFSAELAATCEAEVWAIDYRVAPEHPYPAAVEDAYAAYLALLEKGVKSKDIFVMGDSAGGGLTLALLMKLRDDGKALPKAFVTLSPWADLLQTGESIVSRKDKDPLVTPYNLQGMASNYITKEQQLKEPYASAYYGDFKGLPPLMIVVGGREILYDDSIRVAKKARAAGVKVTLDVVEEMIHIYPTFGGIYKEGKEATDRIAAFIKEQSK
jgi:monoterpene epsilon-lactone hydrolase